MKLFMFFKIYMKLLIILFPFLAQIVQITLLINCVATVFSIFGLLVLLHNEI